MNKYFIKIRNLFFLTIAIVSSPIVYFLIWQRKKTTKDKQLRIFAIPQLTRIGDIVCTTPVFREIKINYPESYLAVLVSRKAFGIIKNNPRIDEFIIYEDSDFLGLVKKIRSNKFNWSFCISATSIGTLLAFFGLITNRVKTIRRGRPISEKLTDWLNNFKLLYLDHTYLPKHHLDLLHFIGINKTQEIKEVFTTSQTERKADDFLQKNNLSSDNLLIGLSITAGNRVKEWGDKNFIHLARKLIESYGAKIILLGSSADELMIDAVLTDLRNENSFKAVNFSLEELPSLIKRLKLLIAVDTGPIYIANAMKIPLIDIVGPCDPAEQPPKDEISIQVLPPSSIKPSSFVFKSPGSAGERQDAAKSIKVEDVLLAAGELIAKIKQ